MRCRSSIFLRGDHPAKRTRQRGPAVPAGRRGGRGTAGAGQVLRGTIGDLLISPGAGNRASRAGRWLRRRLALNSRRGRAVRREFSELATPSSTPRRYRARSGAEPSRPSDPASGYPRCPKPLTSTQTVPAIKEGPGPRSTRPPCPHPPQSSPAAGGHHRKGLDACFKRAIYDVSPTMPCW